MQISMDKKYRTASGLRVKIYSIGDELSDSEMPVHGAIEGDGVNEWTAEGRYHPNWSEEHEFDLVEVSPLEHMKIDDKVLVRDYLSHTWNRRHFFGISEDGKIITFADGRTSWSGLETKFWNFYKEDL